MKKNTLNNFALFLILSGIACNTQADDIYNFYFQKNPPLGAPGTTNMVVPAATQPANAAPITASTTPPPAAAPNAAPAEIKSAAENLPGPEPEFRHWNVGVGLEKFNTYFTANSSDRGWVSTSNSNNNAVSLNLGYDFSKSWGLWAQVYLSSAMIPEYGSDESYLQTDSGPIASQIDESVAVIYTPLIINIFGNHSLRVSLLVGAISATGVAEAATASFLGAMAEPMWGAVASYNLSDKVSIMVDTKDYEQALPSLNYVSDQLGFNLTIKL